MTCDECVMIVLCVQGDMKGLVDSLETLLGDTAPHPPQQHPHTAADRYPPHT